MDYEINLKKKLKKYGSTFVFTINREDLNIFEFQEGDIYDLKIKKAE